MIIHDPQYKWYEIGLSLNVFDKALIKFPMQILQSIHRGVVNYRLQTFLNMSPKNHNLKKSCSFIH